MTFFIFLASRYISGKREFKLILAIPFVRAYLVVRHSVSLFPSNFRDITSELVELNAAFCLVTVAPILLLFKLITRAYCLEKKDSILFKKKSIHGQQAP